LLVLTYLICHGFSVGRPRSFVVLRALDLGSSVEILQCRSFLIDEEDYLMAFHLNSFVNDFDPLL